VSAIDRELRRPCPRCAKPCDVRYDGDGRSIFFEPGTMNRHACEPESQRVGKRPLETKGGT